MVQSRRGGSMAAMVLQNVIKAPVGVILESSNSRRVKNLDAQVVLFGSHARGQATADSDWDILILLNRLKIGRDTEKEYREELFELELEIGEPISTFVYSKNEWECKFSMPLFYENVKKKKRCC